MGKIKPWYTSKGVWGGVVGVAIGAAGFFGITVGEAEAVEITDLLVAGATSVAGLVAVIGRVKADRKIGKAE